MNIHVWVIQNLKTPTISCWCLKVLQFSHREPITQWRVVLRANQRALSVLLSDCYHTSTRPHPHPHAHIKVLAPSRGIKVCVCVCVCSCVCDRVCVCVCCGRVLHRRLCLLARCEYRATYTLHACMWASSSPHLTHSPSLRHRLFLTRTCDQSLPQILVIPSINTRNTLHKYS